MYQTGIINKEILGKMLSMRNKKGLEQYAEL